MILSRLFLMLVIAGIIPVFAGAMLWSPLYAFLFYNIALILLLAADVLITPRKTSLEVFREYDGRFSLGAENRVLLKVRNNSDYKLNVRLKDEIPPYFTHEEADLSLSIMPRSEASQSYPVVPRKRGEYSFGNIHLRYGGRLGLCIRKMTVNAEAGCKVYPNIKDLQKYSLLTIKKNHMTGGLKRSRSYSTGTEFESLREYTEDDDFKKINWMATARVNKLIVNTYVPERNQQVMLMVDSSRVMNSEIEYIKKLDYAINSAFVLAHIVGENGDKSGLLVFDSNVRRFVLPGKGAGHFNLIAENLYNVEENLVTADYRGALQYLDANIGRRSLICIFTELFNHEEALQLAAALKSNAGRHVPLVITIRDPRLYESAETEITESGDLFLKSAAIKLVEEREKAAAIFGSVGIAHMDIEPDKLSLEVAVKYLSLKGMMKL